jgi:hypothetical protein
MQPYLNKLPAERVDVFPQLTAAAASPAPPPVLQPAAPAAPTLGAAYREAEVSTLPGERDPFTVDPALVERGLKGHADTQNELAQALLTAGIEPRSRLPQEPNFDLAWETNGTVFVAEVKSIMTRTKKDSSGLASARYCGTATDSEGLDTHTSLPSSCPSVLLAIPLGATCARSWASCCSAETSLAKRRRLLATGRRRFEILRDQRTTWRRSSVALSAIQSACFPPPRVNRLAA